jgi:hypothetical protein
MADGFQVFFGDGATAADDAFYAGLTSVEVEENADLPGAVQLTLPISTQGTSGNEDLTLVGDDRFKPYARLAVVATPDGGAGACIFDGYVLSHKIQVDRGTTAASLQVWGQDVSCLMNVKEQLHAWTDSDGRIANTIFGNYGFQTTGGNTQDDSPAHSEDGHVLMQRATDAQFLRDRARRNGKLFRVAGGERAGQNTGYFVKPDLGASSAVTLTLNPPADANVDALELSWDVARPTTVLAQILTDTKDPQQVRSTESGLSLLDSRSLSDFIGNDERKMEARLTGIADSGEELRQRAASLLREASWFVRCEGEADLARLHHVLRAATVVQLNGAGRLHSGKYFVWSVRHTITAQAHRMRFVLVRNAVGAA